MRRRRTHRGRGETRSKESGLLLGHLTALVVVTPGGREIAAGDKQLKGWFVGWMPDAKKDFVFVKQAKGRPGAVSAKVIKVFRQFHNSAPQRASVWNRPDPVGAPTLVGLIKSLTYVIPSWMKSPQKSGYKWVHAFGDHGESGHGPINGRGEKVYPQKLMPAIYQDRAGNIFVKRRAGNKYDVTEWIYW